MTNISTENQSALTIYIEAITNKGEDKYLLVEHPTITIGVFDGLGGKSAGFCEETGGRIASREAARITENILRNNPENLTVDVVSLIKMEVCSFLKQEADNKIKLKFKGSLAQRLCTTLAIVNIHKCNSQEISFNLNIAWIGDSRIYFLSPEKGLQQLTKDDLRMENDAFTLIYEDSPMSKHLTADMQSDWEINFKIEKFQEKGCVIACTDGSFQCLHSPWDFEKLLLDTLVKSNNLTDWHNLLNQRYEEIKQDDVSLIVYPIGINFDDFISIKNHYNKRLNILKEDFSSDSTNYNDLVKFWDRYRVNYEERINLVTLNINNFDNNVNTSDSYVEQIINEFTETKFSLEIQSNSTLDLTLNETKGNCENNEKDQDENYLVNQNNPNLNVHSDTTIHEKNNSKIEISESLLCPKCSSSKIIKNGFFKNPRKQRYKCKDCNHNFPKPTRTESIVGVYNSQSLPIFLLVFILLVATILLSIPIV
jgi:serine/threonine protein phosphatase PrpC